eukprot:3120182-Prymnesium_polylepis.1
MHPKGVEASQDATRAVRAVRASRWVIVARAERWRMSGSARTRGGRGARGRAVGRRGQVPRGNRARWRTTGDRRGR